jgi:phosphatidylglycerophosphate synthase
MRYVDDVIFGGWLAPLVRSFCPHAWLHPNVLTLVGLALTLLIAPCHLWGLHWAACVLVLLRTLLDGLDGETARKCDKRTKLGGYLDTTSDAVYFYSLLLILLSLLHWRGAPLFLLPAAVLAAWELSILLINPELMHDHRSTTRPSMGTQIIHFIAGNTVPGGVLAILLYLFLVASRTP